MPIVHYLNVKEGDCSIIQHSSGHVSVIDVCNARNTQEEAKNLLNEILTKMASDQGKTSGNFKQKEYPVNPIHYLKSHGVTSVFRFVVTHPDMDHMDGIKDFFDAFSPINLCDTDNIKEIEDFSTAKYREQDWQFYKSLRDGKPQDNPRRLTLFSGDDGIHRTRNWNNEHPGDAFYVLAPTPELVAQANETEDYNDCSYVILYIGPYGKVLFSGDSNDATWDHLLTTHKADISNIDLLIAPHHGRKSNRDYSFLDVVKPKMTFFGNANSEHLAYDAWNYRKLPFITNNQANCMIVDFGKEKLPIYVTNKSFAETANPSTTYSEEHKGWHLYNIL